MRAVLHALARSVAGASSGRVAVARACLCAIALLLGLGLAPAANALDSREIYEQNENRVFQVRVLNRETGKKSSIGSGFIVGDGRQLATNYHVINQVILEPELFYISYLGSDGSEGELTLQAMDVAHDLALLGAETALGEPIVMSQLPPRGAPIFAMGNPLDLGLTIAVGTNGGILNQTDDSRILFSGSLNPGMSGGPTFDEQGGAIGINVATARNDISFIVPSKFLTELIERAAGNAYAPDDDLKAEVARQVLAYEKRYFEQVLEQEWPDLELRNLRLPGVISPTVRCWDNSAKLGAQARYRRYQIRCSNQNHVYLDEDNSFVGRLIYEYYWLESDELNPLQFYSLYESLNKDQIDTKPGRDIVTNFNCDTWFVEVSSQELKSNLCRREYRDYPGMSDVLFTAALTGHADRGFFVTLIATGVDFESTLPLIRRFLEHTEWTP